MNKCLFLIVSFFTIYNTISAQDIHLSQYKEAPLLINPANTGKCNGDWRGGINTREQWTKAEIPYNTFNVYYDQKVIQYSKVFLVGGYFLYDQINSSGLSKITIAPSVGYRYDYFKNSFRVGIQPGVGFYTLNNKLTHPDQFSYESGTFTTDLPTADITNSYSKLFPDIALGINYTRPVYTISPLLGIAFYHINKPKTSIYANNSYRIPVRTNITCDVPIPITEKILITPSALIERHGKSQKIMLGANGTFITDSFSDAIHKLFVETHYRNAKHKGINAIVLMGGLEYNQLRLALSYDRYFNSAIAYSSIGSSVEITLTFTGINSFTDQFSIPCEIY